MQHHTTRRTIAKRWRIDEMSDQSKPLIAARPSGRELDSVETVTGCPVLGSSRSEYNSFDEYISACGRDQAGRVSEAVRLILESTDLEKEPPSG